MISPKNVRAFRRSLLHWYHRHGRDLPWRATRDPYAILVSELMLQQTQVATVIPYYNTWLRRFPEFSSLARASENDVLHAWQGLGYYARARNLHATAKLVAKQHGSRFPSAIGEMRKLPGIGKYTAHAIGTFAFDQSVPIVEANSARVLSRLFNLQIRIDSAMGQRTIWNRAASLVPERDAAIYNSALLDLGALICLPGKPKCTICPVMKFCRARNPESLPIKRSRPPVRELVEQHALVFSADRILLTKADKRWRGMWILPPLKLDRLKRSNLLAPLHRSVFPFTNHRVTLKIFRRPLRKIDDRHERWFPLRKLSSIPIPSPHRRAIEQLFPAA